MKKDIFGSGFKKLSVHQAKDSSLATTEAEHQVEGGLLLDVVVRKSAAVLELLAREDEALLVGGDALLVLNLGFDVLDGVAGFDIQSDRLSRKGFDENLHI